ncbi:MAG: aminoglycoside phosphotransferase family protein, partial [Actinomycetota bacterium]|nr:aminoglycoside phosphotransferase family protein [Actinomycetota bacterium]
LVPLESVRHALDTLVPGVGWRGRAAHVGVRVGAAPLLTFVTPAAVVARRPGARPLFDWLRLEAGIEAAAPIVSYGDRPSLLVHSGGGLIAKLGPVAAEAETLRELGPAARAAGAQVPEPLRTGAVAGLPLLVETVVPGRPAASELRRGGGARYLDLIVGWLERWNSATASRRRLSRTDLERAALAPLATLDLSAAYVQRVRDLCERVAGRTVPLVAAHHDLTTANVLVGYGLGVVDWDTAEAAALPLTDFFYAVADARAAADGFADRAGSFGATFAADGTPAAEVAELQARLVSALGLDRDVVDLAFHACWLRHAANEAARADATRPFGEIVRRVAAAT